MSFVLFCAISYHVVSLRVISRQVAFCTRVAIPIAPLSACQVVFEMFLACVKTYQNVSKGVILCNGMLFAKLMGCKLPTLSCALSHSTTVKTV